MAIGTIHFNCGSHFAINVTIAVHVLRKVTINAVHAHVQVNGTQVHCLVEFLGVVVGNHIALRIQQSTFAVALENCTEVPAVPVVIGKLRVFQFAVER